MTAAAKPRGRTKLEAGLRRARHLTEARAPASLLEAVRSSSLPRATVAGLLTSRPARFAACELRGGRRLRRHALRGGDWSFCIHHGGADASVLAEVFRQRYYALPPDVERRLGGRGGPLRVADLGAHVGFFALWVLQRHPDAEILSFEPDPYNFAALRCTIAANGARASRWQAVQACAAAADGRIRLAAGASSSSHMTSDDDPRGVTVAARDVFSQLEKPDLVKIDIEGGEWELLADPRFRALEASVLFLEYHPRGCPSPDPRAHAIGVLHDSGYAVDEVFSAPGPVGLVRATRAS